MQLGRNAQNIFQDLTDQHGFTHRYNSIKRFVRALRVREPERFDVLESLPGEEAQVDFGMRALTRYTNGKYRRPFLFVMTLKYSSTVGAFSSTASTANAYVADITEPGDRTNKMGMVMAAAGGGITLGPMLVGILEPYGIRMPFYAASALAVANVVYGLFVLPESLSTEERRPFSLVRANPLGTFRQMCKQPLLLKFLATYTLLMLAACTPAVVWSYYTILMFGWSQRDIGLSLSFLAVAIMVVQGFLLGRVIQPLGVRLTTYIGLVCSTLGLLGYAFATSGQVMMAFVIPFAVGGLAVATIASRMSDHVSPDAQGELQGAVASVRSVAMILAPVLTTALFSYYSSKEAPIYFPGAPYLFGALLSGAALFFAVLAFRREDASIPRNT